MEPQAQAYFDVLEAIFDYADAHLEPRGLGLWTMEKQKGMIKMAKVNPLLRTAYKSTPASVWTDKYRNMGCQIYMLPPYDADGSLAYGFQEPDQPALTKAGFIKAEVLDMIRDSNTSYEILQGIITNCDLQIKNPNERARFPGGRYMPLPAQSTVEWYATSLALALGIKKINETDQQTGQLQSSGMTEEQLVLEQANQERIKQEQLALEQANQERINQEQLALVLLNQERINQERINQEQMYQAQIYQMQMQRMIDANAAANASVMQGIINGKSYIR